MRAAVWVVVVIAGLMTSCSTLNVNSDFDTEFDFSKFNIVKIIFFTIINYYYFEDKNT